MVRNPFLIPRSAPGSPRALVRCFVVRAGHGSPLQPLGRARAEGKDGTEPTDPDPGKVPVHLERPGIEAQVPAWLWAVLGLLGPPGQHGGYELCEVIKNPLKAPFTKESRDRWALGMGWIRGGQEEGWAKQ